MADSLSLVLPVYNAEETLAEQVEQLLDVIGELTPQFELLVFDDGSTDQTQEVAAELQRRYPQVRFVRNDCRRGIAATIKDAMQQTDGDVVFVHDPQSPLRLGQLQRLWQMRHDQRLVMARAQSQQTSSDRLLERLAVWTQALERSTDRANGGIQMIRRQAIAQLADYDAPERELVLERSDGAQRIRTGSQPLKAPTFLSRMRDFTAGE